MSSRQPPRVLVTGATGFIAGHIIRDLFDQGFMVRGTVRELTATARLTHLHDMANRSGGSLELVEADLSHDHGWSEAVDGCTYVIHTASPFPAGRPRRETELIGPAVDGTTRLIRASAGAVGTRRLVMTSSIAAVSGGRERDDRTVKTEADWSDLDRSGAYEKSKTLAERAAWDLVAALPPGHELELVTINPGLVLGPTLGSATSTSLQAVRMMLNRDVPGNPRVGFALVDVRDVARAHLLAVTTPEAAGNRYIVAGHHWWLADIAQVLAEEFASRGYRISTRDLPSWLVRIGARFDPTIRLIVPDLGKYELVSSSKAVEQLGWSMRPVRETIVDTANSMIAHGLVRTGPE